MNNILTLIKVNLIEHYRINKLFKKDNLGSKIFFIIIYLLAFGFLAFTFGSLYYLTALTVDDPNNAISEMLANAFAIGSVISIVSVLLQANGFLFKSKDFDLLVSLPIKKQDIIISKIFTLLIANYLGLLVTYVPAIVVIALLGFQTQFIFYFNALLVFLLFPLALVSIFSFIALLIGRIFRNFKYKNLLIILLAITAVVVYLVFAINMDFEASSNIELGSFLNFIYYPANFAIKALLGSFNYLLVFIIFNISVFLIFINILAKNYLKINTGTNIKRKKTQGLNSIKKSGQNKALIKSEFKKYFSIPQYVINTIIGKVLLPVGMIYLGFQMKSFELDPTLSIQISDLTYILLAGIAVFTITLTSSTTVTISLEGESLWVLKTLPITTNQIFISKLAVDFILTIIAGLIGLVGVLILLPFNLVNFLILTILIFFLAFHNALLGLLINLKFPKLKWDLPIRVIKQSFAVFMHMLISFLLIIILVVGTIFLNKVVSDITLLLAIFTLLVIIIVVIESIILNKLGNKWFNKLLCF